MVESGGDQVFEMRGKDLGRLQNLERSDLAVDMPYDGDLLLLRGFENGTEDIRAQRTVEFDYVIPPQLLFTDNGARLIRGLSGQKHFIQGRKAVDRVSGGVDGRPEQLALADLCTPLQVRRAAIHVEDGSDTMDRVGEQIVGRKQVHMEVGKAGHQVLAAPVN